MTETETPTPEAVETAIEPEAVPVHVAWSRVMADVQAIAKDGENKVQHFKFRGIDATMNTVGPVFRRHGVFCLPVDVHAKHRDFTSKNGTLQHEAIVTVDYEITGPDGSTMRARSIGEAADASDKATTQAMSVAYRTLLLQGLTVPTDSPDPDETTTDRADDTAAQAAGWDSEAERQARWAALLELPGATTEDVLAWGKAQDPPLSPSTLTKDQATAWAAKAIEVIRGALPESDQSPSPAAEASKADEFDRAGAWAMLHGLHNNVPNGNRFSEIQAWLDAEGITEETITKAQAAEYHDRITKAGVDPAKIPEPEPVKQDPPATEPTNDVDRVTLKSRGWASTAELQRTWDSLLSKQQALDSERNSNVVASMKAEFGDEISVDTLTKDQSITWLQIINDCLEEPF